MKLFEDVLTMSVDGKDADGKPVSNHFAGQSLTDETKHILLPAAENLMQGDHRDGQGRTISRIENAVFCG